MASRILPAVASALAVLAVGGVAILYPMGPVSAHMLVHIALMNVLAPLTASALASAWAPSNRTTLLWAATVAQILLLWMWHAPAAHRTAEGSLLGSITAHGSLFVAALLFWLSLMTLSASKAWQAISALLVTGKLSCLLGVLLIFAPRALYDTGHTGTHGSHTLLDDQQLAGLYMVVACPLSFLLAGVIMVAQALDHLGRQVPTPPTWTK
jgi:putative membrane protein